MPLKQSRKYDDSDTNIYKTGGYGGSHNDVDDTERFTDDIDLTVYAGAAVDLVIDGSDGTDDFIYTLYKRRDSAWDGSEVVWHDERTVSNDGSEMLEHYTIPGGFEAGHFRLGLKSSGSTTTFEVQVDYRAWRLFDGIA